MTLMPTGEVAYSDLVAAEGRILALQEAMALVGEALASLVMTPEVRDKTIALVARAVRDDFDGDVTEFGQFVDRLVGLGPRWFTNPPVPLRDDVVQERPERLPGESELEFSARMGRRQARVAGDVAPDAKARAVWGQA